MISITQHHAAPGDLLKRRLEAALGQSIGEFPPHPLTAVRRVIPAGSQLFPGDGDSREAYLIVAGVAGDVRILVEGRRQVISLHLPGDVALGDTHEAAVALTPVEVVDALPFIRMVTDGASEQRSLRRAWIAASAAEQDMLRDQIVRLGRLSAYERMAHFLVETHERLLHIGLATPQAFHLPLRQDVVSDLLGLSVVHLSRVTQQLRRDRLVQARSSYVTLLNRERLADIGAYVSRFASTSAAMNAFRSEQISPPVAAGVGRVQGV